MASIEPFIHRKVVVLHQNATARQAARAMCERAIGCVVVSDHEGHVVGMVTDRDLSCAIVAESEDAEIPIARIMTSPVVIAEENVELEHIIRLMETHGIRRVPVTRTMSGGIQKCIGIVTLDDLVASKSIDEYPLIRIVRAQVQRRVRQYRKMAEKLRIADYPPSIQSDDASLANFNREMISRSGLKKYTWSAKRSEEMIKFVLAALVERLHHTGATLLITQLPISLQEELLDLPAGPDRTVTMARILDDLQSRYGMDANTACSVLAGICEALDQVIDYKHLGHVKAQLPEDLRSLFYRREDEVA